MERKRQKKIVLLPSKTYIFLAVFYIKKHKDNKKTKKTCKIIGKR